MNKTRRSSLLQFSLFDTTALSAPTGGESPLRDQLPTPEAPAPAPLPKGPVARNYRLVGDRALAPTWKGRAADNLAAIRLLQEIEAADRPAAPDEQERLSRFVGFGASELANTLFRRGGEAFRPGWDEMGSELEAMVSTAEMAGLTRATQYAHYTPEFIVRAMWATLTRMGFTGGSVLEPGCGTGLFMSLLPDALINKTSLTGIEADPITARIADRLFPDAWIRGEDFTKARIPETFDLAIGNPPFSDRTVRASDPSGKLGLSLHDYFIARSVERLRPGGVAAFVTSRWSMDKTSSHARAHIAEMADLVGAVRLPQAAMQAAAGTEVVVDILFLQKRRPGQEPVAAAWLDVAEAVPAEDGEAALPINRYFLDHPEMVLGEHARTSSPFGPVYTCKARAGVVLEDALDRALGVVSTGARIPVGESLQTGRPKAARIVVGTAAEGATVKEGKVGPAEIMQRGLPPDVDIVATHPLFGPQSAAHGIRGLKVAVCPVRGVQAIRVAAFLRSLGLRVIMTTPDEHDREAALVQGLTHLIAKVLVQMEPLPTRMTTRSFELLMQGVDMVRHDAPEVLRAIEQSNSYAELVRRRFFDLAAQMDAEFSPQPL